MKCVQMELYHMKTIMIVPELFWSKAPSFFFFLTQVLQIPNGMLQAIFLQTTAGSKTLALCYKQEIKLSIKGAVPFCLYETVRSSFFSHLAQSGLSSVLTSPITLQINVCQKLYCYSFSPPQGPLSDGHVYGREIFFFSE